MDDTIDRKRRVRGERERESYAVFKPELINLGDSSDGLRILL